jgi:hypothetical protein
VLEKSLPVEPRAGGGCEVASNLFVIDRRLPKRIGEVGADGFFVDAQPVISFLVLLLDVLGLEDVLNGRLDELLETEERVSRSAPNAFARLGGLPAKPPARNSQSKHSHGDKPGKEQETVFHAPPPPAKWTGMAADVAPVVARSIILTGSGTIRARPVERNLFRWMAVSFPRPKYDETE